jgi:hypothetical protein
MKVTIRRKFVQTKHHLKITQFAPNQKESPDGYVPSVMLSVGDDLIKETGF